jgi:pyruvate-formate lyase
MDNTIERELTYAERTELLRAEKLRQTREKQQLIGAMNHDDHGLILPPAEFREVIQTISSSGMPITDCRLKGFEIVSNHPSGGFFGPAAVGMNFRRLLEFHPVYIDPVSSLAGGYMANFMSFRKPHWNPDFDFSHLKGEIETYRLSPGIGAAQHFCQDLAIGLELGWGGLLEKIRHYRQSNALDRENFYSALEDVVLGVQNWIRRSADEAVRLAERQESAQLRQNLLEMAEINARLMTQPPQTLREACQWILWYQITARMYNGSGSLGRLDVLLQPFYERDTAAGILTDEEAVFHIACLLLRDTAYLQLGGPDADGDDVTGPVSFLVLEAAHQLKIPANVGIAVGKNLDPHLLRRGVEIMFADKAGMPKFLGVDSTEHGFMRNGYPASLARQRAYSGCHWSALPGREYTMNDCVKVNFAAIFELAFKNMMSDPGIRPSVSELWSRFCRYLQAAVDATAVCIDFHMQHMHAVMPELVLDLLCNGPIEKGLDASNGGVEYYNLCLDGAALATVADSFAALEQRVEKEQRLSWDELANYLESSWAGQAGERARLMMRSIPRYGQGGTRADDYARQIAEIFTHLVKRQPTPAGFNLIPGLFSWANTIPMGQEVGATPNGRRAGDPIAHGANPDPGFRRDGAPTAMAVAIAAVQPGYGNTAPMQIELDPMITREEDGVNSIASLIAGHFALGGTQINLNILDTQKVLEAHRDPGKYPDLVVRVTGFSAFFASLSPEFRQLVVDRMISEQI